MSTYTRLVIALMMMAALPAVPGRAQQLTERDVLRRFYAGNPLLESADAGVEAARAEARDRLRYPNPHAGFEHEGAGRTQSWSLEQTLPLNGRRTFLAAAGAAAVRMERQQADYRIWELCSDLREAFYHLLAAQRRGQVLAQGMSRLQEALRILGERERLGEGSTYDRLRAEREAADLQAEITGNGAAAAQMGARFWSLANAPRGDSPASLSGEFAAGPASPGLEELVRMALERRGDLNSEAHLQERLQWEERAVRRERLPDPVVFAGVQREDDAGEARYGPRVGVSATIPLFNKGQDRLAALSAERARSSARQRALSHAVREEVRGAYEEMQARRRTAAEYRERGEAAGAQLERIAEAAYTEGEIGILELLDSYRTRRASELLLLELEAAAKQAEIRLERVVGTPALNPEVMP